MEKAYFTIGLLLAFWLVALFVLAYHYQRAFDIQNAPMYEAVITKKKTRKSLGSPELKCYVYFVGTVDFNGSKLDVELRQCVPHEVYDKLEVGKNVYIGRGNKIEL